MPSIVRRAIRYGQGIIGLKRDDVLLASFPKSGNTWVRFFFCNLISICEWNGKIVDFRTLDGTMPELGASNLLKRWPYRTIPRIVKTHKNYWPIFRNKKAIFIIRNPLDVMVSFFHVEISRRYPRFKGSLSDFIRHKDFGLESWFKHYRSWNGNCAGVFQYESLRKDDYTSFEDILHCVEIFLDREIVRLAVERSRFDQMRSIEQEFGISKLDQFQENFKFIRQGRSGTGKTDFCDEDILYYQELKRKYAFDLY